MKKIYLTAFLASLSLYQFGQDSNGRTTKQPPKLENEYNVNQTLIQSKATSVTSLYLNYDNQISNLMKDEKIPASFPKADKSISEADYILIMNNWLSENANALKEESKSFKFNSNK